MPPQSGLHLPGAIGMVAVLIYVVAALMALRAGVATRRPDPVRTIPQWHGRVWLFAAVLFAACAVSRFLGIEEGLRAVLRGELQVERVYDVRREFQSVLASIIIVALSVAAIFAGWRVQQSGVLARRGLSREVIWAAAACCVMIVLIAIRMVSLHALDMLLYRGPRLNWVVDMGATFAVMVLAWRYPAELGKAAARMRHKRHSDHTGADELIDRRG